MFFCRPDSNVPAHPELAYMHTGWNGWVDWLGTSLACGGGASRVAANRMAPWPGMLDGKSMQLVAPRPGMLDGKTMQLAAARFADSCGVGNTDAPATALHRRAGTVRATMHSMPGTEQHETLVCVDAANEQLAPIPLLSFGSAQAFVQSLRLTNWKEWDTWAGSELRPRNIPACPEQLYQGKGWRSHAHWLGCKTKGPSQQPRCVQFMPFKTAHKFAKSLGAQTQAGWMAWCTRGAKPANVPMHPEHAYDRDGWKGWDHWLTGKRPRAANTGETLPVSVRKNSHRSTARSAPSAAHSNTSSTTATACTPSTTPATSVTTTPTLALNSDITAPPIAPDRMTKATPARDDDEEHGQDSLGDVTCVRCNLAGDADRMLLCDNCDRGYHTVCLQPVLAEIPAGEWFCASCDAERAKDTEWMPFEDARAFVHRQYSAPHTYNVAPPFHNGAKLGFGMCFAPISFRCCRENTSRIEYEVVPPLFFFFQVQHKAYRLVVHPYFYILSFFRYIKTHTEWVAWRQTSSRPVNIPRFPSKVYKTNGWRNYDHWLGIGTESRMRHVMLAALDKQGSSKPDGGVIDSSKTAPSAKIPAQQHCVARDTGKPAPSSKLPPLWNSTKSPLGVLYYWHAQTRQVQWDYPTNATVLIGLKPAATAAQANDVPTFRLSCTTAPVGGTIFGNVLSHTDLLDGKTMLPVMGASLAGSETRSQCGGQVVVNTRAADAQELAAAPNETKTLRRDLSVIVKNLLAAQPSLHAVKKFPSLTGNKPISHADTVRCGAIRYHEFLAALCDLGSTDAATYRRARKTELGRLWKREQKRQTRLSTLCVGDVPCQMAAAKGPNLNATANDQQAASVHIDCVDATATTSTQQSAVSSCTGTIRASISTHDETARDVTHMHSGPADCTAETHAEHTHSPASSSTSSAHLLDDSSAESLSPTSECSSSHAFAPFAVALKYARSLELNSKEAWFAWSRVMCNSEQSHQYPTNPGNAVANPSAKRNRRACIGCVQV